MKNIIALFLLTLWLAAGSWYYTCKVKKLCATTSAVPSESLPSIDETITPTLLKSAYRSIFGMEEDLAYKESEQIITTGPLFESGLDTIADFLQTHLSTKIIITGQYAETERNETTHTNLGVARAMLIQERLVPKGVLPEQIIIRSELNHYLFASPTISDNNAIDFKFSEEYEHLNEMEVKQAYKAINFLELYAQFFKDREYIQFSESPDQYIEQIKYYLNRNTEHLLQLTVAFTEEEQIIVEGQDIGLLRALDMKQQLGYSDIKASTVLIKSRSAVNVFDDTDLSFPRMVGLNFVFPDGIDAIKQKEYALEVALSNMLTEATLQEESFTEEQPTATKGDESPFTFQSGSHQLLINEGILAYVQELKGYLQEQPEKKLMIIGHTDNIGGIDYNKELGRIRAYSARQLLVNYEISPTKIKISSEGQFNPIASNDLVDGRRLNRRVVIDIQ